ncbi:hypothetical protein FRB94_010817 [Tulasnella sp. JGI-2019a]|nr:hypothetical protein FRB94_010817 [Tulasnella sp. JGI-2019a]
MSTTRMAILERFALERDLHATPRTILLRATPSQLTELAWKIKSAEPFLLVAFPQIRWATPSRSVGYIIRPESKEPAIGNLAGLPTSFHLFVADELDSPTSSGYSYYGIMNMIEDDLPNLNEAEYNGFDAQTKRALGVSSDTGAIRCIGFSAQATHSTACPVTSPLSFGSFIHLHPETVVHAGPSERLVLPITSDTAPTLRIEKFKPKSGAQDAKKKGKGKGKGKGKLKVASWEGRQAKRARKQLATSRRPYFEGLKMMANPPMRIRSILKGSPSSLHQRLTSVLRDPNITVCFLKSISWVDRDHRSWRCMAKLLRPVGHGALEIFDQVGGRWAAGTTVELFEVLGPKSNQYIGTCEMFDASIPDLTVEECLLMDKEAQAVLCEQTPSPHLKWVQALEGICKGELRIACVAITLIGFNPELYQRCTEPLKDDPTDMNSTPAPASTSTSTSSNPTMLVLDEMIALLGDESSNCSDSEVLRTRKRKRCEGVANQW